ncbi:37S ribosomal protein S22 [Teratosphaeriaceae sp. CCFEE 6253]|nr:37S ribosomal protein S22 [Teratosphaeriaceae sp. CCFEE 6253]
MDDARVPVGPIVRGRRRKYTRAGCVVCKTRHLKCDERRPICGQCQSAKWDCGYGAAGPNDGHSAGPASPGVVQTLSNYRPTQVISSDVAEQRSFHYFHLCVDQETLHGMGSGSWHDVMLQAGRSVQAVQHCIFALGFLLQSRTRSGTGSTSTDTPARGVEDLTRASLLQYTKAVTSLSTTLASGHASEQGTLVACLLFIWFEMLQGNLDAALMHLKGGLDILMSLSRRSRGVSMCLHDMYTRLHAQARLHGSPTSTFNAQGTATTGTFGCEGRFGVLRNVAQARQCLGAVQEAFYVPVRKLKVATGNSKAYKTYITTSDMDDPWTNIDELRLRLLKWQGAFTAMLDRTVAQRTPQQATAATMLELQHLHLTMMIAGVLCSSEMDYDQHTAVFARMLRLAESLIQPARTFTLLPLEAGVIPPLFMVALKCRHAALRHTAIALLERAPEQECMWRRDDLLAFARWKLRKEVQSVGPSGTGPRIHCEGGWEDVVDGKPVTVLQYVRGSGSADEAAVVESEIVDLAASMGDIL